MPDSRHQQDRRSAAGARTVQPAIDWEVVMAAAGIDRLDTVATAFFIEGEGVVGRGLRGRAGDRLPAPTPPPHAVLRSPAAPTFRFSPPRAHRAVRLPEAILRKVALAMTRRLRDATGPSRPASPTSASSSTTTSPSTRPGRVRRQHLAGRRSLQGRSPTLDLDSLYGAGPLDPVSAEFYEADRTRLKVGKTTKSGRDSPGSASTCPASAPASASAKRTAKPSPTCATTRTSPSPSTTPR